MIFEKDNVGVDRQPYEAMCFNADGSQLAIVMRDGSIEVFSLPDGERLYQLRADADRIAFSPNGQFVAAASRNRPVLSIWELATKKRTHQWTVTNYVEQIGISPDNRTVACALVGDYTIHTFDAAQGERLNVFRGHENSGIMLAFSKNGRLLATTGWDHTTRIWDPQQRDELVRADLMHGRFNWSNNTLTFRDGNTVAGTWDVIDNPEFRTFRVNGSGRFYDSVFWEDKHLLFSCSADGIYIWHTEDRRLLQLLPIGRTTSLCLDVANSSLVSAGSIGVWRWPIDADQLHGRLKLGPPASWIEREKINVTEAEGLAKSADAKRFAVTGSHGAVLVYAADNAREVVLKKMHDTTHLAMSPNGNWIASAAKYGKGLKIWNANESRFVVDLLPDQVVGSSVFSSDGKTLFAVGQNHLCSWQVPNWERQWETSVPYTDVVACGNLGAMMAVTGKQNREILLLDAGDGRELATLTSPIDSGNLEAARFSDDDTRLVAVRRNAIEVWDLKRIRSNLDDMGLDWESPAYVAGGDARRVVTLVEFDLGLIAGIKNRSRLKSYVQAGRWKDAIQEAEKALELFPMDLEALRLRTQAFLAHSAV